ncbi:MAG: LysM peptidoglycan-binding domain-containing protein [Spirochaetales bacterium]|nr:LysM peptidoglycan-binding domain-containing protein [Spirochaetales bacterium]
MKKTIVASLIFLTTSFLHSEALIHKVKLGDTIFSISQYYKISTNELKIQNNLENNILKIGQELHIEKEEPDLYTILTGDTLSGISLKHDITLKHLLLVNRIDGNYVLIPGNKLIIPTTPEIKKEYTVQKGDTLSWISMTYNIETSKIIELNNLKDTTLNTGMKLRLIPEKENTIKQASINIPLPGTIEMNKTKPKALQEYIVEPGDTLSGIAYEYQTSISDLYSINGITTDNIFIGQKITLPEYSKKREPIDYNIFHIVEKGDTLSGISFKYNISETLLMEINNLKTDIIKVGDKIKLIPTSNRTHKVLKGETLWSIANKYNISVDQLMQYNNLNSTIVQEGKNLNLYDYYVAKHNNGYNLVALKYSHNTNDYQKSKNYVIDELSNPLDKYNLAKDLWGNFSSLISKEEKMSDDLKGWTIVLDPGHGGKDPGAIATVNLNGNTVYIVEDEYAYDTTVRLYELLKRNGADVYMTILSPDHISRNPLSKTTTFINEKNEVYNNYKLNQINNSKIWPVGGEWGLKQRVEIANNFISTSNKNKTIFISVHADNDVDRGTGKLVLYSYNGGYEDEKGEKFAKELIKEFNSNATVQPMDLAVLRGNEAKYKVLIELENMAHLSEAMDLLDNNKRQNDALSILNGIKSFAKYSQE